jgi:membrane protease YdiL (CAAX protease family)
MNDLDLQEKTVSEPEIPPTDHRVFTSILAAVYLLPVLVYSGISYFLPNPPELVGHLLTILSALIFLVLALYGLRYSRISLNSIGVSPVKALEAGGMALLVWSSFALLLMASLDFKLSDFLKEFRTPLADLLTNWLVLGAAEELLFRGYLLSELKRRFGDRKNVIQVGVAMLISSLIFATAHVPAAVFQMTQGEVRPEALALSLIFKFILGMLLAWIFLHSGNLLLAAIVHAGCNAPVLGVKDDLLPFLVALVLIGGIYFIRRRIQYRRVISK